MFPAAIGTATFGALPLGTVRLQSGPLDLYQLEPTAPDRLYMARLTQYLDPRLDTLLNQHGGSLEPNSVGKAIHKAVIKEGLQDVELILQGHQEPTAGYTADRHGATAVILGIFNKTPCGFVVSHMPKAQLDTHQLTFNRHGRPNTTELNWIATWPVAGQQVRGSGSALIAECFRWFQQLPQTFQTMLVRSALPQNTKAHEAYEKMGFENSGPQEPICPEGSTPPIDLIHLNSDTLQPLNPFLLLPNPGLLQPMTISRQQAALQAAKFPAELVTEQGQVDLNQIAPIPGE